MVLGRSGWKPPPGNVGFGMGSCGLIYEVTRMKRPMLIPLAICAVWLGMPPAPAAAVPPDRFENLRFDPAVREVDPFLTDACGFRVTSTSKGHFRGTAFFDKEGELTRLVFHPSFTQTLTSRYGSVTTSDRGMDRITFNPDGTVTVFGTGIHLKVKGGAHAIGLWVLVIDPETEELISAEYHGRFDVVEPEIVSYLCTALGP